MEGKLFGKSQEHRKKQEEIGARALIYCSEERSRLRECFRSSWLGWCSKEQTAFWECFSKVHV